MSKYVDFKFCALPATPRDFDETKFKAGDKRQGDLYKNAKHHTKNLF